MLPPLLLLLLLILSPSLLLLGLRLRPLFCNRIYTRRLVPLANNGHTPQRAQTRVWCGVSGRAQSALV